MEKSELRRWGVIGVYITLGDIVIINNYCDINITIFIFSILCN